MRATAPVVLVIFDEFPVHSLMGADGRIDKRLYPNFARLAADATWYRNTASVDQDTPYAVPAILDGRLPRQERLPVAADHPQNIFSLFGARYELHVREDATALCAPTLCSGSRATCLSGATSRASTPTSCSRTRSRTRWSRTPTRRSRTRGWSRARPSAIATCGCTTTSPTTARPASRRSCDGIEGGRRPRLHLIHILLPHVPYPVPALGALLSPLAEGGAPRLGRAARLRQPVRRRAGLPAPSAPGPGDRPAARRAARPPARGRHLRPRRRRRGGRPRHQLPARPRPAPRAPRQHPGHRPGALLPEGAGAAARPRSATGRCRRSTCCPRSRTCSACRSRGRSTAARRCAPPKPRRREIVAKKFKHTYLVDTPRYEPAKRAALARKVRLFGGDIYAFGPRPDLIGDPAPPGGHTVDGGPRERLRPGARGRADPGRTSAAAVARWPWP